MNKKTTTSTSTRPTLATPPLPELVEPAPPKLVEPAQPDHVASGQGSHHDDTAQLSSSEIEQRTGLGKLSPEVAHAMITNPGAPANAFGSPGAAATSRLRNPRFSGDLALERVAAHKRIIQRGAKGAAVGRLQQSLVDLGYVLPSGVDGRFGVETEVAMRAFQRDQGLRPDGIVGPLTLGRLDRSTPPPGAPPERFPEYHRLFADGVLDTTVAIGFDELGSHKPAVAAIDTKLRERGFAKIDTDKTSPEALRQMGIEPKNVADGVGYYHRAFEAQGKPVNAVVRLITPDTPDPKQKFKRALESGEVVFYGGHARYGTGPDFDHKKSKKENFVIGTNGRMHRKGRARRGYSPKMNALLDGAPNDLERLRADRDRYALWLFNGCTTSHYLDELRTAQYGKNNRTLDIVGSTRPLFWHQTDDAAVSFLDSIMEMKSERALRERLDRIDGHKGAYFSDGFSANAFRP